MNSPEAFERRIAELRAAVRRSLLSGDRARADSLRIEMRAAEQGWDEAIAHAAGIVEPADSAQPAGSSKLAGASGLAGAPRSAGALLPLREQVHHALTLLSVPAAPRLIVEVHAALLDGGGGPIASGKLTHLRRDEDRSFRTAPYARPYYLCSALTAEHLAPVRGLLAVSTWPLERRIIGPLSPRVDFLTAAIRVAEQAARTTAGRRPGVPTRPSAAVTRLLWRFAANISGAAMTADQVTPRAVADAARAELAAHAGIDRADREAGAELARDRLDDLGQLFGGRRADPRATR